MSPNPVDQWTNAELARWMAAVKSQMEVKAREAKKGTNHE